jgi:glucosyl-3-phosphoglycerate synthase
VADDRRRHRGLVRRHALSPEPVNFAVVGHNEAATLLGVLDQALAAARGGDEVWFVDSASSDRSVELAASRGVEVVRAPLGKGRAVAAAIDRCRDGWLCLLDADAVESRQDVALRLREAAAAGGADMVVGVPDHRDRTRRSVTPAVYLPLVRALFPEVPAIERPLSGLRALRAGLELGELPPGYGVEAHLNLQLAATGGTIASCPLGPYRGLVRGYANVATIAADVAAAVLDQAVAHGRIHAGGRSPWGAWAAEVVAVIADQPAEDADDADYLRRLAVAAARPLPDALI